MSEQEAPPDGQAAGESSSSWHDYHPLRYGASMGHISTISGSTNPIIVGSSEVNITYNLPLEGPDRSFSYSDLAVPSEIRNWAVYQKALEKGSETVHRTRLMIVGQERVGKTSLMRSLVHERFNSEELSTEGITTDCAINISSAQSWHCKRGDSTSLSQHELMIGLERESRRDMQQSNKKTKLTEQYQPSPAHRPQTSSAASQTQATETQPRGTSTKSLIHDEVIEKAVSRKGDMKPTDVGPTLNIWDFAGQDLYYTTHQTFLSSRAIYLVVFNLSQDLDKPVTLPDNATCNNGSGGSVTYRKTPIQYLDFWMQSIFTYTKKNCSRKELKQNSPPIFIVGTHRNSAGQKEISEDQRKLLIKKIFDRIREEIKGKPYNSHVVSKFYAIENSLEDNKKSGKWHKLLWMSPPKEKQRKGRYQHVKIQELRKHIEDVAVEEPYMGERIPLNWLTFDDQKGKLSGGKSVMTLKQVMDGFGIEDETELLMMLKFYHDLGHIIYFGGESAEESQALRDVVILDPNWLIDSFKKILTVKPPKEQTAKYRESWDRLNEKGILEDLLINHMWQDILEHKQALLDLMDKFDLLCKRFDEPQEEEKSSTASSTATQPRPTNASYYVPSMLRQQTTRSLQLETTENISNVFYVDFKEFLPDGLYHRLVVRALRWSQDLGGAKSANPLLLCDRANFYVDDHHKFALQMVHQSKLAYIKVSVMRVEVYPPPRHVKAPSGDVTCKVKDFVEEHLQDLKTMWIKRINYCISVQCPDKKVFHFLPLNECMAKPTLVCVFETSHSVIKTDEIQAMFKEESSEEEASAPEPRLDDKTLAAVAKRLGAGWATLAVELSFTMVEVQTVEKNYENNIERQGLEMLVTWKQTQSTRVEEQITTLCTALKNIGKADIAAFLHGGQAPV